MANTLHYLLNILMKSNIRMIYTNYIDLAKLQLYLLSTCVACESSKRNYCFVCILFCCSWSHSVYKTVKCSKAVKIFGICHTFLLR